MSKVFSAVPEAGGPCYSCCAARQEENGKRNFLKKLNRISRNNLMPAAVVSPATDGQLQVDQGRQKYQVLHKEEKGELEEYDL